MRKIPILRCTSIALLLVLIGCEASPPAAEQLPAFHWLKADYQTTPLSEIQAKVGEFYAENDRGQGSGFKQYQSWEAFVAPRAFPDDKVSNFAARTWLAFEGMPSTSAGDWRFVGPSAFQVGGTSEQGGVGRVSAIAFHPTEASTLFAGSPSGGLWKSTDDGTTWIPLTDHLPWVGITDIAIDQSNPRNIFLMTGDANRGDTPSIGVLRSTDGGQTWQRTGLSWSVGEPYFGYRLVVHPDSGAILFAATTVGLLKSEDSGQSWRLVQGGSFRDFAFHPANPTIAYAADTSTVFRSTDSGATWQAVACQPSGATRVNLAVTAARADRVYALYSGGFNPFIGLYLSDDAGKSFSLQSKEPNILGYDQNGSGFSGWIVTMAASQVEPDTINVGSVNTWRSTQAGAKGSWVNNSFWLRNQGKPYIHADINRMAYRDGDLYIGTDGGLVKSSDAGTTTRDLTPGLGITQIYRICGTAQDSSLIYLGAQDNGMSRLQGASQSMTQIAGGDGSYCVIDPEDSTSLYMELDGVLERTTNAGDSKQAITPVVSNTIKVVPVQAAPGAFSSVYYCDVDLWLSIDAGQLWENLTNGSAGSSPCTALALSPSQPQILYLSKATALFRSADGGATWEDRTGSLPIDQAAISNLALQRDDPDRLWVTFSSYAESIKVFFSDDGGHTYSNLSSGLPNLPVNTVAVDPNSADVYIGTDLGVYYRGHQAASWTPFYNQLPKVIVTDLEIGPTGDHIRAATFGRGVWESPLYPTIPEEPE